MAIDKIALESGAFVGLALATAVWSWYFMTDQARSEEALTAAPVATRVRMALHGYFLRVRSSASRLLERAADSADLRVLGERPICPWFGGNAEAGMELLMAASTISGGEASTEVVLSYAGRRPFAWSFVYRFRKVSGRYMIVDATERQIT